MAGTHKGTQSTCDESMLARVAGLLKLKKGVCIYGLYWDGVSLAVSKIVTPS